jgi:predicted anti-sigma-YlaC factor YlaD
MNDCFSESQIKDFYAGMCTEEENRAIQSHLYSCGACSALYIRAAEENLITLPYDLVPPVMAQLRRPPIPKRRLLSIYAIAACATLLIVGSGSIDAIMTASQQIGQTTQRWTQKMEDERFSREDERFKIDLEEPSRTQELKPGNFLSKFFGK